MDLDAWTETHDRALAAAVVSASEEAGCAPSRLAASEERAQLVAVLLQQRCHALFRVHAVRRKMEALLGLNAALRPVLALVDLSCAHVPGRVAWALSTCRHLLLPDLKLDLLHALLDETSAPRPAHADQPEVRFPLHINRLQAASGRPGCSIFEQAHRQLARGRVPPAALRTPFTPPKGVKPLLPFDVHLKGEKVVGFDGPYRSFFADVCRELQGRSADADAPAGEWPRLCPQSCALTHTRLAHSHASHVCLVAEDEATADDGAGGGAAARLDAAPTLVSGSAAVLPPLLLRCPNGRAGTGVQRDMFLPAPSRHAEEHLSLFRLLGQLLGVALRSGVLVALDLPALFWKPFVGEPLTLHDLEAVDEATAFLIKQLRACASAGEFDALFGDGAQPLYFGAQLSDGTAVELLPGGAALRVTFDSRLRFAALLEWTRLRESELQIRAVRAGFREVVPVEVLALFTGDELSQRLCGRASVDLALLRKHTEYGGDYSADSPVIRSFWEVLHTHTLTHSQSHAYSRTHTRTDRMMCPIGTHPCPHAGVGCLVGGAAPAVCGVRVRAAAAAVRARLPAPAAAAAGQSAGGAARQGPRLAAAQE